jgi:hypothetical protein
MRMSAKPMAPLAATLALLVTACTGPPPPPHVDAFQGIYKQSAAAVPANVPTTVRPPVGIIFSDNFENYIGHNIKTAEYWASIIPSSLTNTAVIADCDPTYLPGRLLPMLKSHFPTAALIHDFNEATATGKKAVLLVDIRIKWMEPYGDRTTKFDIDTYFFDSRMNPASKLSGHGEHYAVIGAATPGCQSSIDAAVKELDAKISALARPAG